ncbi:PilX N-terminal domain-containing pilus assembly protein [Pseudomonas oryzihabitans]|uniref:pilus assembly PilX family protein n=1 Tax=Pseudomonas oryzihabitans TaxID=47885 RepID=UPI002893CBE1|nr:PilX N-terminal domain-containing pilus assembly protein [Pseudomonas oryzihabitans]MDT3718951.1 PilX N-terminal domain-containing pilus assembly protein [Pseudomonas oryzihabitans]
MTPPSVSGQRGAVLIVTLVMLLLMTLIALGSMRGTTLQERMASNSRDQSLAFQSAEMAQRQAEAFARTKGVSDWQNTAQTTAWSNADALQDLPYQARYRINPLPGIEVSAIGGDQGIKPIETSVLRIETQGAGAASDNSATPTASTQVSVNTIFVRQ